MDLLDRRKLLTTKDNPESGLDYLVRLRGTYSPQAGNETYALNIVYVPDELILVPESFKAYLDAVAATEWQSIEATAIAILNDIANELVPRWHQVTLTSGDGAHHIVMEDQQPLWENPGLIARASNP